MATLVTVGAEESVERMYVTVLVCVRVPGMRLVAVMSLAVSVVVDTGTTLVGVAARVVWEQVVPVLEV